MKKSLFLFLCVASVAALVACGSNSNSSSSDVSSGVGNTAGLEDGKWPAAVYDKYGIDEIKTNGRIVFTQFGEESSYLYEVYYKDVTRAEMQAWIESLKAKGFRISDRDQEIVDNNSWESVMLYQPEEGKDMRLRITFDWKNPMSFEYYADEINPAFEIDEEKDDEGEVHYAVNYNFEVSLNPMDNKPEAEGSIDALGITAGDIAGVPGIRSVRLSSTNQGGAIAVGYYADHLVTEADGTAIHGRVADALAAKGAKFYHAMSGKEYTAEQLKADGIRTYMVEKDGVKYLLMPHGDASVGYFGSGITFGFTKSTR